jgi:hypothetical protein
MIVPLLLAATIDGQAALQHASRLAALGPHPWGSALGRGAAQYVASQLRTAGVADVRLEEFEKKGIRGVNVVGVRPGTSREILVIGAHHDTAPGSPGAYDDGGGVGILIEVARALAHTPARGREIALVSFDGEEGWSRGELRAGSRAYLDALGPRARDVTAAIIIEMSGWKDGTPTFHAIAYADPMRPGESVITPAWLARAALRGAREEVPAVALGDRYLSWLCQPAVRLLKARLYGDDQSFLERGLPAIMISDSSFSRFYPWYHDEADTAEKLDATALARVGAAVLGAVRVLETAPAEKPEAQWWTGFGVVLERGSLMIAGFVSLLPVLVAARAAGKTRLVLRMLQAAAFAGLLWREPVVALWCFGLANLAAPFSARRGLRLAALAPFASLVVLALVAWARGLVSGFWLAAWELGLAAVVAFVAMTSLSRPAAAPAWRKAARSGGRRAGLPRKR